MNFNVMVSMQNKYYSKQTNSSLFAQKIFSGSFLNMGYCQYFQTIATNTYLLQLHEKITRVSEALVCLMITR